MGVRSGGSLRGQFKVRGLEMDREVTYFNKLPFIIHHLHVHTHVLVGPLRTT